MNRSPASGTLVMCTFGHGLIIAVNAVNADIAVISRWQLAVGALGFSPTNQARE